MKILFLAHRIPYPPNKGDKLRAYNIIRHLAAKHDVYLVSLYDNRADGAYAGELKKICKEVHLFYLSPFWAKVRAFASLPSGNPFTVAYFGHPGMKAKVDAIIRSGKVDRIFAYSSSMAQYVMDTKIPKIMDFVDCDSAKWGQYGRSARFPMSLIYEREHVLLGAYEKKIAERFEQLVVVTEAEKDEFTRFTDTKKFSIIANGVDTGYFKPSPDKCRNRLIFTGAMDYYANIDAVIYFCDNIFPLIKKRCPAAEFYIVGHKPSRAVKQLARRAGVIVTGGVTDIRDYLSEASVAVVPLRIAQGIQNKILEAMASGLSVITTPKAAAALAVQAGRDLFIAETAEDFAEKTLALLQDHELRKNAGQAARRLVEEKYSWERNLSKLDELIQ